MVMDILGVLIAFTSIILLLSIIVTSMTQLTQATFRMRARNLVVGVAALLRLTAVPKDPPAKQANPPADEAKERKPASTEPTAADHNNARALLNTLEAGNLSPRNDPNDWFRVFGPAVSWIDEKMFIRAAAAIDHRIEDNAELSSRFNAIEATMEKRFLLHIRFVTALWAVLVAFWFQLSAPDSLRELWSNPEMRRELEDQAATILSQGEEAIATFQRYEQVSAAALERLAETYPDDRARIEEASGVGTTKAYIVDELALALEGSPNKEKILADYRDYLDEERLEQVDDVASEASQAATSLAALKVEPWSRGGWAFYANWRNVAGVLVTAMLLMLGAPFWFNALKQLVSLRDAMKGKLQPSQ